MILLGCFCIFLFLRILYLGILLQILFIVIWNIKKSYDIYMDNWLKTEITMKITLKYREYKVYQQYFVNPSSLVWSVALLVRLQYERLKDELPVRD